MLMEKCTPRSAPTCGAHWAMKCLTVALWKVMLTVRPGRSLMSGKLAWATASLAISKLFIFGMFTRLWQTSITLPEETRSTEDSIDAHPIVWWGVHIARPAISIKLSQLALLRAIQTLMRTFGARILAPNILAQMKCVSLATRTIQLTRIIIVLHAFQTQTWLTEAWASASACQAFTTQGKTLTAASSVILTVSLAQRVTDQINAPSAKRVARDGMGSAKSHAQSLNTLLTQLIYTLRQTTLASPAPITITQLIQRPASRSHTPWG